MQKTIKIGTRDSNLALWQANKTKILLEQQGLKAELVLIKSDGDKDLITPLYKLGIQGIFTKTLDSALLNNTIDIAVHSMKDVPTQLAQGLAQAAVLPRGNYKDYLIYNGTVNFLQKPLQPATIATCSLRRKAQWLNKYPHHNFENLRGNINSRLKKLKNSNWQGALFAAAAIERLNVNTQNIISLDWMLPAPAQGAIMIVCKENDSDTLQKCKLINDSNTALCTQVERTFLNTLQGGCSTPIAALATIKDNKIFFEGNILSLNGKQKLSVQMQANIENMSAEDLGHKAALQLLQSGGAQILEQIKNEYGQ